MRECKSIASMIQRYKNLEAVNEITATSLAVGPRFLEGTALFHHEFVTRGIEGTQIGIRGGAGMRASVHRELCEYL